MKNFSSICPSLICGDPFRLEEEILEIKETNVEYLHFDIMDGNFVPRLGMYPEQLRSICKIWDRGIDVHLMVEDPEQYIDILSRYCKGRENIILSFHFESTKNPMRVINSIKEAGFKVGLSINLQTRIEDVENLLSRIDLLNIMAINPGVLNNSDYSDIVFSKLDKLKMKNRPFLLEIDGNVRPHNIAELRNRGVDLLICGSGTVYEDGGLNLKNKIEKYESIIDNIGNR